MLGKKLITIGSIASLLIGFSPMLAQSKTRPTWQLPKGAVQVDEDTYYLGIQKDPKTGKMVEGFAFLKHRDEAIRGGNSQKPGGKSICYAYLASGAK
jgi:hypothetical protein